MAGRGPASSTNPACSRCPAATRVSVRLGNIENELFPPSTTRGGNTERQTPLTTSLLPHRSTEVTAQLRCTNTRKNFQLFSLGKKQRAREQTTAFCSCFPQVLKTTEGVAMLLLSRKYKPLKEHSSSKLCPCCFLDSSGTMQSFQVLLSVLFFSFIFIPRKEKLSACQAQPLTQCHSVYIHSLCCIKPKLTEAAQNNREASYSIDTNLLLGVSCVMEPFLKFPTFSFTGCSEHKLFSTPGKWRLSFTDVFRRDKEQNRLTPC